MDTILNKLVKDKIADILEETSSTDQHNITVGERRIAITHAIAAAWLWLHQYKQDSIIKAFEQTGISLCPSGKDDHKLYVRGLPDLEVGPWQLESDSESDDEFVYFAEHGGLQPGLQPDRPTGTT